MEVKINNMKTLGKRIAHFRNKLGWSQVKLAKECNWANPARIANYELDKREPSLADLAIIAKALGIDRALLIDGTVNNRSNTESNVSLIESELNPANQEEYPLISWSQVGDFIKGSGLISVDDKMEISMYNNTNKIFRLEVIGDSMVADKGISVSEGYLITVDTSIAPKNGQCVIAVNNETHFAFRQYIEDAGTIYLKPFNKAYKMIELTDDWRIIGTVTKAEINLL